MDAVVCRFNPRSKKPTKGAEVSRSSRCTALNRHKLTMIKRIKIFIACLHIPIWDVELSAENDTFSHVYFLFRRQAEKFCRRMQDENPDWCTSIGGEPVFFFEYDGE